MPTSTRQVFRVAFIEGHGGGSANPATLAAAARFGRPVGPFCGLLLSRALWKSGNAA